jgi:V/A-type H+-transporting ATPase subunit A
MSEKTGKIIGINGNMITVEFPESVRQNEVGYAITSEGTRLKSEVIRIRGNQAEMQVFEETNGLTFGNEVEFTDELLTAELGPGLLGQVYDGLQNPLPQLAEQYGIFLSRGVYLNSLNREKGWEFTPVVKEGDIIEAGDVLGKVQEGIFDHKIMVPFNIKGYLKIIEIRQKGHYTIEEKIAIIQDDKGNTQDLTMSFSWPVKIPINIFDEKLLPTEPLVTGTRIIDSFFPVARGGTYCIPGPFGAGKTVLQQVTSRYAQVNIVIIAACGERAGEVVEILREFPHLEDPQTGRSLMERTIIICNTSSMPVAAREASVYTAVTLAEYYRQMGLHVLLLADSTSRWAQALREMSGRLEEIPGEEAFPAYLESRIATFYERAGIVRLKDGTVGSVTLGGTVSPAGGNFEEPVTQGTLKVVGAFHGLSQERSDARRYPAIHPLESWSKYSGVIEPERLGHLQKLLFHGDEVRQMMKVVGEEGTSLDDYIIYLKSELIDSVYLQQNSFDDVDAFCSRERQNYLFDILMEIVNTSFELKNKEEARKHFAALRQRFIDWNYSQWETEDFKKNEIELRKLMNEGSENV